MNARLYDIMSDFNDIINDIDSIEKVLEIQFDGIVEVYDSEIARSILNVHLRLLKRIHEDCKNVYEDIDKMLLDMKHQRI